MPSDFDPELEAAWSQYREGRLVTNHAAALSKREFMAGIAWARKQTEAELAEMRVQVRSSLGLEEAADNNASLWALDVQDMQAKLDLAAKGWDMMHFSCDNPDHAEAYKIAAPAFLNDSQEQKMTEGIGHEFTPGHSMNVGTPPEDLDYVNIVFDGPPSHDGPRFIEAETVDGRGRRIGEWVRLTGDREGEWALQIPISEPAWEHELTIAQGSAANMKLERDREQARADRLARKLEAINALCAEEKYRVRGDQSSYTDYWEGYSFMQDLVQQVIESPEEDA